MISRKFSGERKWEWGKCGMRLCCLARDTTHTYNCLGGDKQVLATWACPDVFVGGLSDLLSDITVGIFPNI